MTVKTEPDANPCKQIKIRRYVREMIRRQERKKFLLVKGSCGTVSLFQDQQQATLVVSK